MLDPFGNATAVSSNDWRQGPTMRGTGNILSTCMITLILCLWTAVHVNIPRHKEPFWHPELRKFGWLITGLLAPEMLTYSAWYQRRAAHEMTIVMRRGLGQAPDPSMFQRLKSIFKLPQCIHHRFRSWYNLPTPQIVQSEDIDFDEQRSPAGKRHRWTSTHSFYTIMGGFVFDTSREDINYLPHHRQRLTVTPSGLLYILEHEPDLIPDLSEKTISDKSKANGLAKMIVCLQATWFCVQCLCRFRQGLAVSLLELNVFAHAICSLLMYLFWWEKPLDVKEPTIISGSMSREMSALMCMRSTANEEQSIEHYHRFSASGPEPPYSVRYSGPELPYGVRYGSLTGRDIVETSEMSDDDWKKSRWRRQSFVTVLGSFHPGPDGSHETLAGLYGNRREGSIFSAHCCLDWRDRHKQNRRTGSAEHEPSPVELRYADGAVETKEMPAVSPSNQGSVPKDNHKSPTIQHHRVDSGLDSDSSSHLPVVTNSIHGFSVWLGARQQRNSRLDARIPASDYSPTFVTISKADALRWQLCDSALLRYYPWSSTPVSEGDLREDLTLPAYGSVWDRCPDWPTSRYFGRSRSKHEHTFMLIGFSLAGFVYGGLHLLAWNAPFSSTDNTWWWRVSAAIITASGAFGVLTCLLAAPFDALDSWAEECASQIHSKTQRLCIQLLKKIASYFALMLSVVITHSAVVAYVAARVFLLVESFTQLRHLPDSVYVLPAWTQYFPHMS